MTITSAVQRLSWRFGYENDNLNTVWDVNENDLESLNTITEFVEEKHKKQINEYQLFAKLYVMVFSIFLDKYKSTVFDKIAEKQLHRFLDKPLEDIIQRFTDNLNKSEMYAFFDDLDIELRHPATLSKDNKEKEFEAIREALKDENKKQQFYEQVWDYKTVEENIKSQINLAINQFKNT